MRSGLNLSRVQWDPVQKQEKIIFHGSQEQFLGGLSLHLNHLIA